MKSIRSAVLVALLTGLAIAQDARDLFTTAQANRSLSMFAVAIQSSGMAKMLREEGPLTVFALSNRAFANLAKEDLEALLTNRAAMHVLLEHYIARGSINDLSSARTLLGGKLRADIRSEGSYVNGAQLKQGGIRCTNGTIHVLDSFDPGLVRDAVAVSTVSRRQK
jgi:uncharacterized surface protein with fasciclin (FAS1) repeats